MINIKDSFIITFVSMWHAIQDGHLSQLREKCKILLQMIDYKNLPAPKRIYLNVQFVLQLYFNNTYNFINFTLEIAGNYGGNEEFNETFQFSLHD